MKFLKNLGPNATAILVGLAFLTVTGTAGYYHNPKVTLQFWELAWRPTLAYFGVVILVTLLLAIFVEWRRKKRSDKYNLL